MRKKAMTATQQKQSIAALKKVVKIVGSQRKLAIKWINEPPQLVSKWMKGTIPIGARHVGVLEKASGGQVKRSELRPDIFYE